MFFKLIQCVFQQVTIRSKLEEGLVSPFYADKIKEERAPTALSLSILFF